MRQNSLVTDYNIVVSMSDNNQSHSHEDGVKGPSATGCTSAGSTKHNLAFLTNPRYYALLKAQEQDQDDELEALNPSMEVYRERIIEMTEEMSLGRYPSERLKHLYCKYAQAVVDHILSEEAPGEEDDIDDGSTEHKSTLTHSHYSMDVQRQMKLSKLVTAKLGRL